MVYGGGREIRTLAKAINPTTGLANPPLQPTWVPLRIRYSTNLYGLRFSLKNSDIIRELS